ncbi:O-acetyl-ADP-ribose deacetylase [Pontibacter sp. E15-1]|uniref:O-acetyl-ADP-ribose deacetylase n=1 Tax=Pontibacter sp. E15-1 TaxID=2919918 RepID=UPI001F4FA13F|nr:O-acetyl-ADP-ribose deacetylase [Pontibacter sp. E15-1]MCJ8164450.1 O-acetyl-ADP-ribose deacetylase [Pontibacter sp. E15-1]
MEQTKIEIQQGDITKLDVDAIVNAANSSLLGGGGVDGAIHRAGGPAILAECKKIVARQGSCPTGEAVITTGGKLPARYVIHTVGPVWHGGEQDEPQQLANCYRNSLRIATEKQLKSIAFPNISTGVYGYPKEKAAKVAVQAVNDFIRDNDTSLRQVIFVCFDAENLRLYEKILKG